MKPSETTARLRRARLERWLAQEIGHYFPIHTPEFDALSHLEDAGQPEGGAPTNERPAGASPPPQPLRQSDEGRRSTIDLLAPFDTVLTAGERVNALATAISAEMKRVELANTDDEARLLSVGLSKAFDRLMRAVYESDVEFPADLQSFQFDADQPDAATRFFERLRGKSS